MIKRDQIPDEARFAAITTFGETIDMKKALAAAINAWPDMRDVPGLTHDGDVYHRMLHLPVIPKEKNND